jgi:rubrerythrin
MEKQALLDKLSEFLMVEQGGLQLYRVVAARATDPRLKRRYEEFGKETERHRAVLIRLIETLGGDPNYVSPTARLAQVKASKLIETGLIVDGLSQQEMEANDLENVLLAETKDHADWHLLSQLVGQVDDPKMKQALEEAVNEVESEEDEHLTWARDTLAQMCLKMVLEGPAPSPERWQRVISGPIPPIDQLHPAPMSDDPDLLPPAKQPPWQDTPIVRSAGRS